MPSKYERPQFSGEDAVRLAEELWGIKGTATELPSYLDRNYLITSDETKHVLKISATTELEEVVEYQNQALEHLEKIAGNFSSPHVLPTLSGARFATVDDDLQQPHFVRIYSYIHGRVLAEINPHTNELLQDVGEFLGQLSKSLEGFDHPATHRDFYWDLKNAPRTVSEYRHLIENDEKREIVDYMYKMFDVQVQPKIRELRKSVVHNDANDYNILVNTSWPENKRDFGIIDFGDMVYTCTVFELAIAVAYAILDKPDPVTAAANVIAGYHQIFPLTEDEIQLLFPMICMRLTNTVCTVAHHISVEPENEYIRISEAPAWKTLSKLRMIHPNRAWYQFREACGFSPHPDYDKVTSWLRKNQSSFTNPLGYNLAETEFAIIDLSVGSYDYGAPDEVSDPMKFAIMVDKKLEQEGATFGLGRYNEPRMIYAGTQYSSQDNVESRTVHIGLDFFAESGIPIVAPMDGIIHSFKNNNLPYDNGPTIVLEHKTDEGIPFFTLYGHLTLDSISKLNKGQLVSKGQEFARIGEYPTNGGWPSHLHFQVILDMLNFEGDYYGVCWPSQGRLWTSLCPDPNLILGISPELFPSSKLSSEEILQIREEHLGRNLSISYERHIKMVRGYMQYLYEEDGRQYLDCVNNVPHVGHSHPAIVKAIQDQAKVLYTNTRYLHDNLARYAERLCATLPDPLNVCFFVNSGSEANELALRLARAHTKRDGFIVIEGAYHGNTDNLVGLSSYKHNGLGGTGPPDNVQVISNPDPYRSIHGSGKKAGKIHAEDINAGIERTRESGHPVAAFICEPVMSCAGQIVFPPEYLKHVYKHIRDAGGVCIADEVQIGFGRMGTHFWGFETQGVVPDIVTLGKPIGNGHPLGAVVTTSEIAESFNNGMEFFSTTGGNTVSCAVGLAVLDVIENENLQENAHIVGEYLKEQLMMLKEKHALIGDVRGIGLFLGVELVGPGEAYPPAANEAHYIVNRMRDLGVLLSVDGTSSNVLKIKPPIVFSKEDADLLITRLDSVLSEDFPSGND